ncbi:hypothetical protein [Bacillus sp. SM2101]|uniref:hypothetical protein n=1 Tax=Bacillus sp. SM2101 TaxID=2805366 RepID=UPI001BDDF4F2|nr:hypothetical protein [Bacillus sp. SM2101]
MKKNLQVDYNQHYKTTLVVDRDIEKIKASEFKYYFSELIIKYSYQLATNLKSKSEESN